MTTSTLQHTHHNHDSTDIFGFWIYIMSDCILFATIFATFAVLHNNLYGGLPLGQLTNLSVVFTETITLLMSSFTYGLAILALYLNKSKNVILWLLITCIFGLTFIYLEVNEFIHLYSIGQSWKSSAALSAFFTLVGTHGLHVTLGLLWMVVLIIQLCIFDITPVMKKRLTYLGLFWAFLDIIWIFVFTIVYLMGAI